MYRDYVIKESKPFVSCNFNLTVEIPLKAINRGYSYDVLPNSWANRKTGKSKLNIMKMGLRYFFTMTYCLIEKWLLKRDCTGNKE
jgi:dolichol-phosphate mannosyltransferase